LQQQGNDDFKQQEEADFPEKDTLQTGTTATTTTTTRL
jgi:hypothetical protein